MSPVVVRKSDMKALNYDPAFFLGLDAGAESAGEAIAEGAVKSRAPRYQAHGRLGRASEATAKEGKTCRGLTEDQMPERGPAKDGRERGSSCSDRKREPGKGKRGSPGQPA